MRYQGGKSRIATSIALAIERESKGDYGNLVSLFCGSCAVESKLAPHFKSVICNDNHKYLIALWRALQSGCDLPEVISEDTYKSIRENKDVNPALTGFVGFGCSFGGKFFGGYARNKTGTNYAAQSKRSILLICRTPHSLVMIIKMWLFPQVRLYMPILHTIIQRAIRLEKLILKNFGSICVKSVKTIWFSYLN